MPNWCYNKITITGEKEDIDRFNDFLTEKDGEDWFDFFLPCPQELKDVGNVSFHEKQNEQLVEKYGHSDWYSWSIENWGCKWNCSALNVVREDDETISFSFDSPWAPPTSLYQRIANGEFGEFNVTASYLEEGMGFVGRFEDGFDESFEYSDLESLDFIPDDIVEDWNLREQLEEQEEWDSEDSEDEEMTEEEIVNGLDKLLEDYNNLTNYEKMKFKERINDE